MESHKLVNCANKGSQRCGPFCFWLRPDPPAPYEAMHERSSAITALRVGKIVEDRMAEQFAEEASESGPGGRPTKYLDEMPTQARKLAQLGATDIEIADFFEVDVRTLYRWKHEHDEFCQALKGGKEIADERVERSLYQKAIGYEQDEVKIFMPANASEPVYAPFRAKIAPDTTAAIFWLKNRRAAEWRDKQDIEHTGAVTVTKMVREIVRPNTDNSDS